MASVVADAVRVSVEPDVPHQKSGIFVLHLLHLLGPAVGLEGHVGCARGAQLLVQGQSEQGQCNHGLPPAREGDPAKQEEDGTILGQGKMQTRPSLTGVHIQAREDTLATWCTSMVAYGTMSLRSLRTLAWHAHTPKPDGALPWWLM